MSDDTVLLKIKREFTSDEAVAILQSELAGANFKIGELKSEIAELKHKLNKPKPESKASKEWHKDDFIKLLNDRLHKTQQNARKERKDAEMWQNKYFSLMAKIENKNE